MGSREPALPRATCAKEGANTHNDGSESFWRLLHPTLACDGSHDRYFKGLSDGTQAWAEPRNGAEITNGGLNVVPR